MCALGAPAIENDIAKRKTIDKISRNNEEIGTSMESRKLQPKIELSGAENDANIALGGDLERMQRGKCATQGCMTAPGASEVGKHGEKANFDPSRGCALRTRAERTPKACASAFPHICRLDARREGLKALSSRATLRRFDASMLRERRG